MVCRTSSSLLINENGDEEEGSESVINRVDPNAIRGDDERCILKAVWGSAARCISRFKPLNVLLPPQGPLWYCLLILLASLDAFWILHSSRVIITMEGSCS